MYDPYRHEANPLTELKEERSKLAAKYRSFRSAFRGPGWNHTYNHRARHHLGTLPRPTVEWARKRARDLWGFATAPIPNHLPCGADDAYGERQDYMRSEALALWRAVGRFD